MKFPHGVALSISAKQGSRRVSFFLTAYSGSETLLCLIICTVMHSRYCPRSGQAGETVDRE